MLETGTVLDTTESGARVRIAPGDSCDSCARRCRCAGSEGRPFVVDADNACGARPGDSVQVEMRPVPALVSILLVFVAPLILFLSGLAAGRYLTGADWGGVLGGVFGLGVGLGLLRLANRAIESKPEYRAVIVRVAGPRQ